MTCNELWDCGGFERNKTLAPLQWLCFNKTSVLIVIKKLCTPIEGLLFVRLKKFTSVSALTLNLFPAVWLIPVHPCQQTNTSPDSPSLKLCYYCLTACLQSYCRLYWMVTQTRAMWHFLIFPEWLIWLKSVMVCTVTALLWASTVELCWSVFKDLLFAFRKKNWCFMQLAVYLVFA